MSYLVLARKYRPKNFGEMVGQGHVVQALSNALTQQRLHHAYLFTGTRGVGKTTVSRILAKSLNCQGPDGSGGITATPCGVCQACRDIDSDRFVDYTEMDAASTRGIDNIRELLDQANYKPVQGRFKVYMIDEVHQLTKEAFSALLKTLEEPPDYLKFVLATTDPQKVPVTVLSRCLQFNLRPMAPETVHEHLERVLAAEGVQAQSQALRLLARAARGSMRDALSLTDQAIAFGDGALQEEAVRRMLGSVDRTHVFQLIEALSSGDARQVLAITEALRVHGLSAAGALEEMAAVLQRMAVVQAVPDAGDANDPDDAEIARLAALMPADETQLLYTLCLHGRAELGLAPDEYAGLTMVLLRLLAFKPGTPADTAEKKTLNAAPPPPEAVPEGRPVPVSSVEPGQAVAPAPSSAPSQTVSPPAEAPSANLPPGHVLPVVDPPTRVPLRPAAQRPVLEGQVMGMPVRQQPESAREAAAPASTFLRSEDGDFWYACVQQLVASDTITALVRELALQSQLVARDEGHWLLRVERESLNQGNSRERLQSVLRSAGHEITLGVEIGAVSDSPARRNAAAAAERLREAEQTVQDDPFVQQLVRDLGAKVAPGGIRPS